MTDGKSFFTIPFLLYLLKILTMNVFICGVGLILFANLVESYTVYNRHKFDSKDCTNHLSHFYDSINKLFAKKHYEDHFKGLFNLFLTSDFDDREGFQPNIYSHNENNVNFTSDSEGVDGNNSGTKIAECVLSRDNALLPESPKFYLPLKDAEIFSKNLELINSGNSPLNILNVARVDKDDELAPPLNLKMKCTPVIAEDVTDTCKACMYFEEMIIKRHFRFGQLLDCTVIECMNGYDEKMSNSPNKGYFVFDFVKYHPMCIT